MSTTRETLNITNSKEAFQALHEVRFYENDFPNVTYQAEDGSAIPAQINAVEDLQDRLTQINSSQTPIEYLNQKSKKLLFQFHPDRNSNSLSQEKFKVISSAVGFLRAEIGKIKNALKTLGFDVNSLAELEVLAQIKNTTMLNMINQQYQSKKTTLYNSDTTSEVALDTSYELLKNEIPKSRTSKRTTVIQSFLNKENINFHKSFVTPKQRPNSKLEYEVNFAFNDPHCKIDRVNEALKKQHERFKDASTLSWKPRRVTGKCIVIFFQEITPQAAHDVIKNDIENRHVHNKAHQAAQSCARNSKATTSPTEPPPVYQQNTESYPKESQHNSQPTQSADDSTSTNSTTYPTSSLPSDSTNLQTGTPHATRSAPSTHFDLQNRSEIGTYEILLPSYFLQQQAFHEQQKHYFMQLQLYLTLSTQFSSDERFTEENYQRYQCQQQEVERSKQAAFSQDQATLLAELKLSGHRGNQNITQSIEKSQQYNLATFTYSNMKIEYEKKMHVYQQKQTKEQQSLEREFFMSDQPLFQSGNKRKLDKVEEDTRPAVTEENQVNNRLPIKKRKIINKKN